MSKARRVTAPFLLLSALCSVLLCSPGMAADADSLTSVSAEGASAGRVAPDPVIASKQSLMQADDLRLMGDLGNAVSAYVRVVEARPDSKEDTKATQAALEIFQSASLEELDAVEAQLPAPEELAEVESTLLVGAYHKIRAQREEKSDPGRAKEHLGKLRDVCVNGMEKAPESFRQPLLVENYMLAMKKLGEERAAREYLSQQVAAKVPPTMLMWACKAQLEGKEPSTDYVQEPSSCVNLATMYFKRGRALENNGKSRDARPEFAKASAVAWANLWRSPNHYSQIEGVDILKKASLSQGDDVAQGLLPKMIDGLEKHQTASLARFLLQEQMTAQENRNRVSVGEALWHVSNLSDELDNGYMDTLLQDVNVPAKAKGELVYRIGMNMYELDNLPKALEYFDYVVANFPGVGELEYRAALARLRVLERQNWEADAEVLAGYYEEYITKYPYSVYIAEALLREARVYMLKGNYPGALSCLEEVITSYGDTNYAANANTTRDYIFAHLYGEADWQKAKQALAQTANASDSQLCGPRALMQLLAAKGVEASLEELAQLSHVGPNGASMLGLSRAASKKGVSLTGVRAVKLSDLTAPFIAHTDNHHYVLVEAISKDGATVRDGEQPAQEITVQEFTKHWSGMALVPQTEAVLVASLPQPVMTRVVGGTDALPGDVPINCDNYMTEEYRAAEDCCKANIGENEFVAGWGVPRIWGSTADPSDSVPFPYYKPVSTGTVSLLPGGPTSFDNPTQARNVGYQSSRVHVQQMSFQNGLAIDERDIVVPVRGPMKLMFRRNYHHAYGWPYAYHTDASKWYKMNVGAWWAHNWNVHLRVSSERQNVVCFGADGHPMYFTKLSSQTGYDIYTRGAVHTGYPNEVADGTTWEQGYRLYRYTAGASLGTYDMYAPNGTVFHFAAETGTDAVARLEWVGDASVSLETSANANKFLLEYYTAAPNTGYLQKVKAPGFGSGENRYLNFEYGANHQLSKVSLMRDNGGSPATTLQQVNFAYNTNVELTTVAGVDGRKTNYTYNRATTSLCNNNAWQTVTYYWLERIQETKPAPPNADIVLATTDFGWTYGKYTNAQGNDEWNATKLRITKPNLLVTEYNWVHDGPIQTVHNYDGTTKLDKMVSRPAGRGWRPNTHEIYADATTTTNYRKWDYDWYGGSSAAERDLQRVWIPSNGQGGLTEYLVYTWITVNPPSAPAPLNSTGSQDTIVFKPTNTTILDYTYGGGTTPFIFPASKNNNAVTYAYAGTDLDKQRAQVKLTGITINTPTTQAYTYAYDTHNQVTQINGPSSQVWTYAYDGRGNLTSKTLPGNVTTTYVYNDDGNITSKTDNTGLWQYSYSFEGCSNCPGAKGQLSTAVSPGNLTYSFTYDNAGNLSKIAQGTSYYSVVRDALNRITSLRNQTEILYNVVYDKLGRVYTVTEYPSRATPIVHTYTYDYSRRMTRAAVSPGSAINYAYDQFGSVTAATNDGGTPVTPPFATPEAELKSWTKPAAMEFPAKPRAGGPGEDPLCDEDGDIL